MRFRCFMPLVMAAVGLIMGGGATTARAQDNPQTKTDTPSAKEDPIAADRPGFTFGTDTVPVGKIQFEIGAVYSQSDSERSTEIGDSPQIRFPVTNRFEARLGLPPYTWARDRTTGEKARGFGDTSLSVKYRFVDDAPSHPSLAFIGGLTLRTGSASFREDRVQPTLILAANQNLGEKFALSGDLTYNGIRSDGVRYDEYTGGLCLTYAINPLLAAFVEGYRISDDTTGGTHANYMDGGFTYLIGSNTQVDISAGIGAEKSVRREFFIGAGIARRW